MGIWEVIFLIAVVLSGAAIAAAWIYGVGE